MHNSQTRRIGETLLIVSIIIILIGIWVQGSERYVEQAQEAQAKQQVVEIAQSLRAYYTDHGEYPGVVHNLRFCEPFRMYQGQLCLWQLLDEYVDLDAITFGNVTYIYAPTGEVVVLAADIAANHETPMGNRCKIGEMIFWCLTLPK